METWTFRLCTTVISVVSKWPRTAGAIIGAASRGRVYVVGQIGLEHGAGRASERYFRLVPNPRFFAGLGVGEHRHGRAADGDHRRAVAGAGADRRPAAGWPGRWVGPGSGFPVRIRRRGGGSAPASPAHGGRAVHRRGAGVRADAALSDGWPEGLDDLRDHHRRRSLPHHRTAGHQRSADRHGPPGTSHQRSGDAWIRPEPNPVCWSDCRRIPVHPPDAGRPVRTHRCAVRGRRRAGPDGAHPQHHRGQHDTPAR